MFSVRLLRLTLFLGVNFIAGIICAQYDAKTTFAKFESSVVHVLTEDSEGTGFAVGDGTLIITCDHVVESDLFNVKIKTKTLQTAKVLWHNRDLDVAILKLNTPLPNPLKILPGQSPATGSKVFVIGYPLGIDKFMSEGIVSGKLRTGDRADIQFTASISAGSSGSPVFDESGQVIAMAQGAYTEGNNLYMGLSAFNLNQCIASIGNAQSTYIDVLREGKVAYTIDWFSVTIEPTKSQLDDIDKKVRANIHAGFDESAAYGWRLVDRSASNRKSQKENQPVAGKKEEPIFANGPYLKADGHINFKLLFRDLKDEDKKTSERALQAFAEYGVRAIPDLFLYLEEDSPGYPKRDTRAASFLRIFGSDAKPYLIDALTKGTRLTRLIACQTIGEIAYFQVNAKLIDGKLVPGRGDDPWVFDDDLKNALLDACDDKESFIRISALTACLELGYRGASRAAEKILLDERSDEFDRFLSVQCLLKFEAYDPVSLLNRTENMLKGPGSAFSPLIIAKIKNEAAYEMLDAIIKRKRYSKDWVDEYSLGETIVAMGTFRDERTLKTARSLLGHPSQEVQFFALLTMGSCGDEDTIDEMVEFGKGKSVPVRKGVVYGIANTRSDKGYETLCKIVKLRNEFSTTAIEAFVNACDLRAIEFLRPYLQDNEKEYREKAKEAIDKLKLIQNRIDRERQ